jgi:hypothetical protein
MTISHSTMNYRKVVTKLNENNVIQTMSSMNYFDSSSNLYFEWKSIIMEMRNITKFTNLHVYSTE